MKVNPIEDRKRDLLAEVINLYSLFIRGEIWNSKLRSELIKVLTNDNIQEIDNVETEKLEEIDSTLFDESSPLLTKFRNFIRGTDSSNNKKNKDFYSIFFRITKKHGSKRATEILREEIVYYVKNAKMLTDLELIEDLFLVLDQEDLLYIFEDFTYSFSNLILASKEIKKTDEIAHIFCYILLSYGKKFYRIISEIISKLDDTNKREFILLFFGEVDINPFESLSKEETIKFLELFDPKDIFRYSFELISIGLKRAFKSHEYIYIVIDPGLETALQVLIKEKPQEFKEVYEEELSFRGEQEITEIMFYLLFYKCFEYLPNTEVELYFNSYNFSNLVKTFKLFVETFYEETFHFSKLGKLGINLFFFLLENNIIVEDYETMEYLSENLKEFEKSLYPIIIGKMIEYSQNRENFESFGQVNLFCYMFLNMLDALEEEYENEILFEREFNLIELIYIYSDFRGEYYYDKLIGLIKRDYKIKDPENNILIKSFIGKIILNQQLDIDFEIFISNFLRLIDKTNLYSVLRKYDVIEHFNKNYQKNFIINKFLMQLFFYAESNTILKVFNSLREELKDSIFRVIATNLQLDSYYSYKELNRIREATKYTDVFLDKYKNPKKFTYYYDKEYGFHTYVTTTIKHYTTERYFSQIKYTVQFPDDDNTRIMCTLESHQPKFHSVNEIKGVVLLETDYISYAYGIKRSNEYEEIITVALLGFLYWTKHTLAKDDEEGRLEYAKKIANEIDELINRIIGNATCYSKSFYKKIQGNVYS